MLSYPHIAIQRVRTKKDLAKQIILFYQLYL